METVCSASVSESSENETTTVYDPSLNFASWLTKQQEYCSEITTNNIEGFKQNESKVLENIKQHRLEIQENIKNVSLLNMLKCSNHSSSNLIDNKESLKDTIDSMEDCEQKVAQLENEIKVLEKQHKNNEKIDLEIAAYRKAIQCHETNLNLKSVVLTSNEDKKIIETVFENKTQYPVKMVIGNNNDILSFEISSGKTTKEYNEITNWFAQKKNPVGLMVKLRKYILNLKE